MIEPGLPVESSSPRRRWIDRGRAGRGLIWLLIAMLLGGAFIEGIRLRHWAWETTKPIRYHDIDRGLGWGLLASGPEGFLNQYEKMAPQTPKWSNFLDYGVLRLGTMTLWSKWARVHYPDTNGGDPFIKWRPEFEFSAPVLRVNMGMELLAATCALLLTRLWVRRSTESPNQFTGMAHGIAAALIYWFNPAVLLSAYGWPIWDGWIIPFYLLAALLASCEWWFLAGAVLGIGAMFKGQQFAVAQIFILWPLVQGRVGPALRWAAGMTFAIAAIVSPFLFSYLPPDQVAAAREIQSKLEPRQYPPDLFAISRHVDVPAIVWVGLIVILAAITPFILPRVRARFANAAKPLLRNDWFWRVVAAIAFLLAVIWPAFLPRNHSSVWIALIAGIAGVAAVLFLNRRAQRYVLPAIAAVASLLCIQFFHGSHAWWDCGIHFGTIHWQWMVMSVTDNLPGILADRYGWTQDVTLPLFTLAGHVVTTKMFFNTIAAVLMAFTGLAIGIHAKRRNRAMLIALTTPWLIFFSFPVQIHERYLLFAAGVSAIAIGCGLGFGLFTLFISAVTVCMTIQTMMFNSEGVKAFGLELHRQFPRLFSENAGPIMHKYIVGTHPDIAWGVLVITGVFFYLTVTPWREKRGTRTDTELVVSAAPDSVPD